jgi:hypothetical protein
MYLELHENSVLEPQTGIMRKPSYNMPGKYLALKKVACYLSPLCQPKLSMPLCNGDADHYPPRVYCM